MGGGVIFVVDVGQLMGQYDYCIPKYQQSQPFRIYHDILPFLKYPLQCHFCVRQGLMEDTENKETFDDDDDNCIHRMNIYACIINI